MGLMDFITMASAEQAARNSRKTLETIEKQHEDDKRVADAVLFLNALALRLDGWAEQSRSGGWSTHQVDANRQAADDCRHMVEHLTSR